MMNIGNNREGSRISSWCQRLLFAAVFLFPIMAGNLEHMASSLLMVSGLIGLFLIHRPLPRLGQGEWIMISGLAAFVLVAAISLVHAADPAYGFRKLENLGKLLLFPVFLLGWRYLPSPPLKPFSRGLLVAGPVYLLTGLVQIYGHGMPRAMGAYNPIVYGQTAILILALLGSLLIGGAIEQRLRIWAMISMGCALAASILSGTRGAWLLLPVLAVVWCISSRFRLRKIMLLGAALLLFFTLGNIDLPGPNTIRERMTDALHDITDLSRGNFEGVSEDQRFVMWQAAFKTWQEYPWLGTGLGGFRHQAKIMIAEGRTSLHIPWTHAHSIYFEFLATTGLIGLIGMLGAVFLIPGAFFSRSLREASSRENRAAALAALVALLAFAVFGLTESWLSRSPLLSTYLFCLLVFSVSLPGRCQNSRQKAR